MSADHLSKSFDSVTKLLGKENYVLWHQRITLALSLTRSRAYIDEKAGPPTTTAYVTSPDHLKLVADWNDRDHQIAAGILSTCEESILSAHIPLLDYDTGRSKAIFRSLTERSPCATGVATD